MTAWVFAAVVAGCLFDQVPPNGLPPEMNDQFGEVLPIGDCSPSTLPIGVLEALARHLQQDQLSMAGPNEDWNSSCVPVEGLPDRQLLYAGQSPYGWVIHFREGGLVLLTRALLLREQDGRYVVIWDGYCDKAGPRAASPSQRPELKEWECRELR